MTDVNWVELIIAVSTVVFFAGVYVMQIRSLKEDIRSLNRENVALREHNDFQDKQLADYHTTNQVILTELRFISKSIERVERKQDSLCDDEGKVT